VAADLADAAWTRNLEEGINKRTMDALHAYEEGVNQLALCAWWFYGDPVHFERAMISARSAMKLMVETPDGRVHFGGASFGIEQARKGFKKIGLSPGRFGWAPARLFLHPMYEVALYNRNPAVLRKFERWGATWAGYQKPGRFVEQVDILTGEPVRVSKAQAGPIEEWLALYQVTGDPKWLEPVKLGMDPNEYWGFQPSYGRTPFALLPWEEPIMDKVRRKLGSGYAGFFLHKDRARLHRWLADSASWYGRFPYMFTAAEQKTDRVFTFKASTPIACYLGDAPNRNRWVRYNAVSYEGLRGEDFAALVWDAGSDRLRVAIYNFRDEPLSGQMRVWRLDHGRYRVRLGEDKNDDGAIDAAIEEKVQELQRYSPIALTLPARQITVIDARQLERLDDILERADLALSAREIQVRDGVLSGVVHNIGSAPVREVRIAIRNTEGRDLVSQSLGELEAPLDLVPRRITFTLRLPAGSHEGWRLVVDPDNRVPEICEENNEVLIHEAIPAGQ